MANNAYKHGLRSERNPLDLAADAALPAERAEFLATLEAFRQDLLPQGAIETRLVERLAQIDIRLQRAVRMDTTHLEMHAGLLSQSMEKALPTDEQTRHKWLSTLAFLKSPSATTLIAQYEARLSREFARTLAQLRQAQKLRNQTQFTVAPSLLNAAKAVIRWASCLRPKFAPNKPNFQASSKPPRLTQGIKRSDGLFSAPTWK